MLKTVQDFSHHLLPPRSQVLRRGHCPIVPVGLAAPRTPRPTLCWTCWPQPYCSDTSKEQLLPKDDRFLGENIYIYENSEAVTSGGNCTPTHSPHFRMQKPLKTLQVSPYPTKRIQQQFFTCGTTPESSEVICHRSYSKVRYQAKMGIRFSNLWSATLWSCPLPGEPFHHSRRNSNCSLPKTPRSPLPPGWRRCDPTTSFYLSSAHFAAPSWPGDAFTLQGSLLSTSNPTAVGSVENVVIEAVLSPNSKKRWEKLNEL